MPECARMARISGIHTPRLTSGSPPVRRMRRMPMPAATRTAGRSPRAQDVLVREGRHAVRGHAVDAAEVALVGNGNAQVVDIAAKAVMLHAPVHAALPSRGVLFFRKHNTPRENHADTRTTGQVASSKTDFPKPILSIQTITTFDAFPVFWRKTSNVVMACPRHPVEGPKRP